MTGLPELPELTPTEWLTVVLVIITAFYAWQNVRMVKEMRAARGVSVLPRLVPSLKVVAPDVAWMRVTNAGLGPALDVRVALTLEPAGWTIDWRAHVVAPAETHDFIPTRPALAVVETVRLTALTQEFSHIRLRGECRDALGEKHKVDERIEIREWWKLLQDAHHLVDRDEVREIRQELELLRKATEKTAGSVERWRSSEWPDAWAIAHRWKRRVERLPSRIQPPVRRVVDRFHPDPWRRS